MRAAAPLVYAYCVVSSRRAPRTDRVPRGLPGTPGPRVLSAGEGLWLVVTAAPRERYDGRAIEAGLRNLGWVSACATAHEAVVAHFAGRDTTVPLKLFALFETEERAVAEIDRLGPALRRLLGRLAGRQEWGVRVRLDPARARRPVTGATPAAPRTGTDFLRAKKRQRDLALDLAGRGRDEVEALYEGLAATADDARRHPPVAADGIRLVLDAAFLVRPARLRRFRSLARAASSRLAPLGLDVEVTGPWPAYNFVGEIG
jgi:hypothetical protein